MRRPILWLLLCCCAAWLIGCGGRAVDAEPRPTPRPSPEPTAAFGGVVFAQQCAICHAIVPDLVVRGPSLYGIAGRAGERVPGQDARTYIYTSIMRPDAFIVPGFENVMPGTLAKTLTGEQIDAVVAYLYTLGE